VSASSMKFRNKGLLEQQGIVSGTALARDKSNDVGNTNANSILPFSVSFEKVLCSRFNTMPKKSPDNILSNH